MRQRCLGQLPNAGLQCIVGQRAQWLCHLRCCLGRQETQALLDHLAKEMPKLVEDLVPKVLPLGVLQKVLQNLLAEDVHIRDMRTIIETLAESAVRTQDPEALTTQVRIALGRSFHEPVEGFRPIGRVRMIGPGLDGDLDDPLLRQPDIVDPAANVGFGWPALPPGGQGSVGRKAQRCAQLCEEPIKIGLARSRVLLLLYWFT